MLSGYPHLDEAYRFAELVFPLLPLPLRNRLVSGNPLFGNPLGPFGETVANDFVPRASQSCPSTCPSKRSSNPSKS